MVTQFHPDYKSIEQVWHNTALLQTYHEEKYKVSELTESEVKSYVGNKLVDIDSQINNIDSLLANNPTETQRTMLEAKKIELQGYSNRISGITSKSNLIQVISESVIRLEQDNAQTWNDFKNTGIMEFNKNEISLYSGKTTNEYSSYMAILPGKM